MCALTTHRSVLRAIVEWDVDAPQRLGLTGVWVDGPGHGLPGGSPVTPHRIIRSFPELLDG
jgi:putative hydrolase of the HAD superfamily